MATPLDRARNDDADDDGASTEEGQVANQGPIPAEPEDVSDAGEGRLAPQMGGDEVSTQDDVTP